MGTGGRAYPHERLPSRNRIIPTAHRFHESHITGANPTLSSLWHTCFKSLPEVCRVHNKKYGLLACCLPWRVAFLSLQDCKKHTSAWHTCEHVNMNALKHELCKFIVSCLGGPCKLKRCLLTHICCDKGSSSSSSNQQPPPPTNQQQQNSRKPASSQPAAHKQKQPSCSSQPAAANPQQQISSNQPAANQQQQAGHINSQTTNASTPRHKQRLLKNPNHKSQWSEAKNMKSQRCYMRLGVHSWGRSQHTTSSFQKTSKNQGWRL